VLELRNGAPGATAELLGETAGAPVRFVIRGDADVTRRFGAP
jgi:hypothetical protein